MDRVLAARKLIDELVASGQLEARRPEVLGRELAALVTGRGRPPGARELEEWLGRHRLVAELYTSTAALEGLLARHLPDGAGPREARHPELERQIRAAPDEVASYLVYSDWLQEQGDPLGELIALGVAATGGDGAAASRHQQLLDAQQARFLGGMARHVPDPVRLRWRFGLVHAIEVLGRSPTLESPLDTPAWEQLLGLRICELTDSVTTHWWWSRELVDALTGSARRALRSLTLLGCVGGAPELAQGQLEELVLRGDSLSVGPRALPAGLQRLELGVDRLVAAEDAQAQGLTWPVRELQVLLTRSSAAFLAGHVKLPRLERLTVELGGAPSTALPRLLEALAPPALAHLTVQHGKHDAEAFRALLRLPLAGQLRSLALLDVELTDRDLAALLRDRGALAPLEVVELGGNELTPSALELAASLAPEVRAGEQRAPGSGGTQRLRALVAPRRLQEAERLLGNHRWLSSGVDGEVLWACYRGNVEYELFVTRNLLRHGCSCQGSDPGAEPCKHVVALALMAEAGELPEAPDGGIRDRLTILRASSG